MRLLKTGSLTPVNESITILRRKGNDSQIGLCPFCSDQSGHLEIEVQKGLFYCHRCASGGRVVSEGQKRSVLNRTGSTGTRVPVSPKVSQNGLKRLSEDTTEYRYLVDRGLSPKQILDLEPVMVSRGWISCPLRDYRDAEIKGFIHRTIYKDQKPKYLFTPKMARTPWGLHRHSGPDLVIVEGHFDASGDTRAVATLGKTIGLTQILPILSRPVRRYVLALDGDAVRDVLRVACKFTSASRSLLGRFWVSKLPFGKDPEDVGIQWCIDNCKPLSEFIRES